MDTSAAASESLKADRRYEAVWFENPRTGRRVRIRVVGWGLAGFLFGPIAMLCARLWLNAVACAAIMIAGNLILEANFHAAPSYLLPTVGAVWGAFIPKLMALKYERMGWIKV